MLSHLVLGQALVRATPETIARPATPKATAPFAKPAGR